MIKLKLLILFAITLSICVVVNFNSGSLMPDQGLLVLKPDQITPGYTLFTDILPDRRATLIDVKGNIAHQWRDPQVNRQSYNASWQYVDTDSDWNLYAVLEDKKFIKLDKNSKPVWESVGRYHHNFDTLDQQFFLLEKDLHWIRYKYKDYQILGENVVVFNTDGMRVKTVNISKLLEGLLKKEAMKKLPQSVYFKEILKPGSLFDVYQAGSIRIVKNDLSNKIKRGDVLLTLEGLNQIVILDKNFKQIKWRFSGDSKKFVKVKDAQFNSGGNIIFYAHKGYPKQSRVVELSLKKKIVKSLQLPKQNQLVSRVGSMIQQLPNQNILLTAIDKTVIYELSTEGEILWLYQRPKTIRTVQTNQFDQKKSININSARRIYINPLKQKLLLMLSRDKT